MVDVGRGGKIHQFGIDHGFGWSGRVGRSTVDQCWWLSNGGDGAFIAHVAGGDGDGTGGRTSFGVGLRCCGRCYRQQLTKSAKWG